MSQVEPMTAAEYRQWCNVGLGVNTERVLAALEERERLLGEREALKADRDSVQERLDNFLTFSADCDDLAWVIAGELGLADKMQGTGREWVNYLHTNRHLLREAIAALKSDASEVRWECKRLGDDLADLKPDASLGALVRRIREHEMSQINATALLRLGDIPSQRFRWFTLSEPDLAEALSHLDSLLPKEPEVVTGPSGRVYRVRDGGVEVQSADQLAGTINSWWVKLHPWSAVVTQDAPVVAKLMEGQGHD